MNKQIRQFEKESGIEIYGLGTDRSKWEASLKKFTDLLLQECIQVLADRGVPNVYGEHVGVAEIKQHFGIEQ